MKINMETKKLKGLLLFLVMGLLLINYYIPLQNTRHTTFSQSSVTEKIDREKFMEIILTAKELEQKEEATNKDMQAEMRKAASSGNVKENVNKLKNSEEIKAEKIRKIAAETPMERSWAETLVEKAEKYEIDIHLLLGIIRVESVFEPQNVSSAGAVGIMQIMPGTARYLADKVEVNYSREMLFDPHYNIKLGTAYINYLYDLYDGDLDKVLTAYNRGEGGLGSYIRRTGTSESAFSRIVLEKADKYEEKIKVPKYH